jgi:hypothetical protein
LQQLIWKNLNLIVSIGEVLTNSWLKAFSLPLLLCCGLTQLTWDSKMGHALFYLLRCWTATVFKNQDRPCIISVVGLLDYYWIGEDEEASQSKYVFGSAKKKSTCLVSPVAKKKTCLASLKK